MEFKTQEAEAHFRDTVTIRRFVIAYLKNNGHKFDKIPSNDTLIAAMREHFPKEFMLADKRNWIDKAYQVLNQYM